MPYECVRMCYEHVLCLFTVCGLIKGVTELFLTLNQRNRLCVCVCFHFPRRKAEWLWRRWVAHTALTPTRTPVLFLCTLRLSLCLSLTSLLVSRGWLICALCLFYFFFLRLVDLFTVQTFRPSLRVRVCLVSSVETAHLPNRFWTSHMKQILTLPLYLFFSMPQ